MKKILLIFFYVCAGYCSTAQTLIPRFENLGVNEGLPHSSVYSITQDKKGFMWFGTADGLCRYDGSILKTFKYAPQSEQDVVNNFVRGKMQEDKSGNIWFCNESGIYKWDFIKERVIRVKIFDKNEFNNVAFRLAGLDNNNIWMFNIMEGVVAYNITTAKLTKYPLPYKTDLSKIVLNYTNVDNEGNIWVKFGSKTDPFIVFNMLSGKYSIQLSADAPHAVFFEKNRRILAYDEKLVYEYGASIPPVTIPKIIDGTRTSFYSFDGITDNYGRLWMTARGNGLFYYDEKNSHLHEYHHDNSKIKSLPFDLTTCLFIDRNENLWIGMDGAGVVKLDLKQPKFNLFPLSEGDFPILNDYFTKCFFEDSTGRIWFGTHTGGLNIFDPALQTLINYRHENGKQNSLPGNIVGSILKDRNGNMWIGSSGGISMFHEKGKSFETIVIQDLPELYPLRNNFVYKMVQLANGDFLAATLLGIIKVVKEKSGKYKGYYFRNSGALGSVTTDVVETADKTIYATLPGHGLYQLIPEGNSYKQANTFLNGIDLRSIRIDEKNAEYLWIGSGTGLIHFNTISHAYKVWNEKDGLANSYVYGSLEDAAGNLWISTNKGLSFFSTKNKTFENYSFQDGLQSNEFNTQSFYKSSTGIFYFGGIRGFNWFKPDQVSKENIKPVAAITRIEISDSVFQKDSAFQLHQSITVPYDKNDFGFQFAALDYTRPEANNIQYTLQGWDAGWVVADSRSARYENLPPGNYTLKLKVSNANGVWSDEEMVNIIIQSPFWKRPWFVVVLALLLIAAIVFITYRVSQLKVKRKLQLLEKRIAVDDERNRISADMHDEIGSGITHIALLSELIQTQQKDSAELKKDINKIGISSRKLVQTMSEIIWALNPQNDTLENLLAYIREQSYQYFEPMGVRFNIYFPETIPDVKLSNAERRNLYLVTREALNNALKHSGAECIELKMEMVESACCFSVTDNGVGIDLNINKPGNNGIINMKKRMTDIGGSIEWLPQQHGTAVKYCLVV